jgi:hypothetical protein
VAVLRRDYVVRRYPLTAPQHALLEKLRDGATIGAAIEAAAAASDLDDDALAAELRGWFRFWSSEGFFAAVA